MLASFAAANWTSPIVVPFVISVVTALALYMCFATICGWWPTGRAVRGPSAAAVDSWPADDGQDAAGATNELAEPASAHGSTAASQLPVVTALEPGPVRDPTITDRWHYTSDGLNAPEVMRLIQSHLSHPGYMGRQAQEAPPSVKVAVLVACQPVSPDSGGTELRALFLAFLNSAAVRAVVEGLTTIEPAMSWKNLAGNGLRMLEAALTASEDAVAGVPAASAVFLPPVADEALFGHDGRAALILYVEPKRPGGEVPPASDLATWLRRIALALTMPEAFVHFLESDMGLATAGETPAQFGLRLQSYEPLTVMVDTNGLHRLPGAAPMNQFIGYALAAADGKPPAGAARDMLVQLCEYALRLDDYERGLEDDSSQDPPVRDDP